MGMSRVPSPAASSSATVHPVHVRHHQIEKDEVRLLRAGERQCLLAVGGLQDLDPGHREVHLAEQPDRRLVVGHEHARRGLVCLGGCAQGLADPRSVEPNYPRIPRLRRVFAAGGRTRAAPRGEPVRSSCA